MKKLEIYLSGKDGVLIGSVRYRYKFRWLLSFINDFLMTGFVLSLIWWFIIRFVEPVLIVTVAILVVNVIAFFIFDIEEVT